MAAAEVGTGAEVVVLTAVSSTVGAALAGAGGVASVGAGIEEEVSGIGAVVAKGGVGVNVAGVGVVAAVDASPADSSTTGGLVLSTAGLEAGSFSREGVGSEGCRGAFGSSEESEDAASKLPKDVGMGKAEAAELDWGTEKAGLAFDSEGLNKLPETATLDKSAPEESSTGF